MRLGIMQPYFFPYLGYFALIRHTDNWVVFDTVQYINKGWLNRNRILSQSHEGTSYITVPVIKKSRDMLIKDVLIDNTQNWQQKILGQLTFYKKRAPFYNETLKIVTNILNSNAVNITELNIYALKEVCKYLGIEFNYKVFSEDTMDIESVEAPDEWALEISKAMSANVYVNPPGGRHFFNQDKYEICGIKLKFLNIHLESYPQRRDEFKPGLSILDVMMFNRPDKIVSMLDNGIYYDN